MVSLEGMALCNSWERAAKGKDYLGALKRCIAKTLNR
jgi:hypothetical protein